MVGAGAPVEFVEYLEVDEIVEINRRMIATFGGLFTEGDDNFANRGSLEYILEAIHGSLFGHDLYPTLIDKAAALAWWVIARHVFHDGNKRTGIEACRQFLELNGRLMRIDGEVTGIAVGIAEGRVTLGDVAQWLDARVNRSDQQCTEI